MVDNSTDYIEHHGIKGQKHGVRRGPPYPLKDGAKNVGSNKAKKKVSSNSDRSTREARAVSIINSIDSDSRLPTIRPASDFYKKIDGGKENEKDKKIKFL